MAAAAGSAAAPAAPGLTKPPQRLVTYVQALCSAPEEALGLTAREVDGNALQVLHESRPEISYQSGSWRLAHLVFKVMLVADGPRPSSITVKIKPSDMLSFPRQRHQQRIMKLLAMNEMLCEREPSRTAVAAE